MSAVVDNSAAAAAGKSTRGLAVGDATRAMTLPQLPYADAVHAELTAAGLMPDVVEAGMRAEGRYGEGLRELFIRAEWLPGHEDLAGALRASGLVLQWSHLAGWSLLVGDDLAVLDVDEITEPVLLVDAVQHVAEGGTADAWVVPFQACWEYGADLDGALVSVGERGAGAS